MRRLFAACGLALALTTMAAPAEARHSHRANVSHRHVAADHARHNRRHFSRRHWHAGRARFRHRRGHHWHAVGGSDPRPSAWCAWFLRRLLGVPKSEFPDGEYNLAAAFKHIGSPAPGPAPGVIVVYPHHVAIIKGECDGSGCVMLSGNDGNAVKTRYRKLRGAIAFRRWGGAYAAL